MTEEEEREALCKTLAGEASAFEPVVRAYEKRVYTVCFRMLGSPEDAADAAQEAFLKAYVSLASYRGEGKLGAWLCRIAGNQCLDMLRQRQETLSLSLPQAEDGEGSGVWDIPDERLNPAVLTEREETRRMVREAVDSLPPAFRLPLVLREYGNLSYEEISRSTGLDPGTVKTRIFRARKKLCALLGGNGNFSPDISSKKGKGGKSNGSEKSRADAENAHRGGRGNR